jgi:hypothetical protein
MNVLVRRPAWRKVPWGLAGMLGLLLAVEAFVQRHETQFMTPFELDWKAGALSARRLSPRFDVLCFGDSMLKFGLSPRILEQRLGLSVFSLALLDGKPPASYFLLRRSIESGARPRLILVDFQPECMYQTSETMIENRHWKGLLDVHEGLDLARTYHDPDLVGRVVLWRCLPSYKCRTEIRDGVKLALAGKASPNPDENAKVRRNRWLNRGGMLLAKSPAYDGEVRQPVADILFSQDWFNRPEQTSYVRRFMALAERHQIPVLWVLPPNSPKAHEGRERVGLNELDSQAIATSSLSTQSTSTAKARRSSASRWLKSYEPSSNTSRRRGPRPTAGFTCQWLTTVQLRWPWKTWISRGPGSVSPVAAEQRVSTPHFGTRFPQPRGRRPQTGHRRGSRGLGRLDGVTRPAAEA